MSKNQFYDKKSLILTILFMALTISIAGGMAVIVISDPAVRHSQSLFRAAKMIRDVYPDTVNWQSAMLSARQAIFEQLDPFSSYINKEQLDRFVDELSGGYHGIGVSVTADEKGLLIMTVRETGPAAVAGILTGDIITKVDSIKLGGLSSTESIKIVKGEEGTTITATVLRPASGDTLQLEIERKRIDFLHVPYAGIRPDSFVYVRLLDFDAGATDDLKAALDSLILINPQAVKGLILDLRDNPGGLFEEARKTVDLFFDKNQFIVGSFGRSRWESEEYYASTESDLPELKLAILVNSNSASSAEIVAGALKYSGKALIVGDTTFGKGLVQGYFRLPDGDGLRLTISRYYFEGGKFINSPDKANAKNDGGIIPDLYIKYIETNAFYNELESSLVLFRFAHKFQDEIIGADNSPGTRDSWVARLKEFALADDFDFESETTEIARYLESQAATENIKSVAALLTKNSRQADKLYFKQFADFIWLRLRQLALERKFGTYRSYKDAFAAEYEPIQIAIAALKKRN